MNNPSLNQRQRELSQTRKEVTEFWFSGTLDNLTAFIHVQNTDYSTYH